MTECSFGDTVVLEPSKPVRILYFRCPCGRDNFIFVSGRPPETVGRVNVWHYEICNDKITISPSVDLTAVGHPTQCHFSIVGANLK